jgi:hypothetical protein
MWVGNSSRCSIWYNWHTCCRQSQQMLLVVSIHAVCFGRTNHLQAFKYRILKLIMNAYFCLYFWGLRNFTSHNNLYVALKYKHLCIYCSWFTFRQKRKTQWINHTQNIKNVSAFVLHKDYYGLHNLLDLTNLEHVYLHFILSLKSCISISEDGQYCRNM